MKRIIRMGLIAVLVVTAQCGMAQTVKVGTFDKTSIVVAFYRSPMWSAKINAALAEREKARAAGDQKRVDELSKWGQDQQELAHKQLAGEAPIDNILEMMKPMFAAVAAQAHVASIVPEVSGADKTAATVDVTDLLLDQLQADAKTRQIVDELRKTKPDLRGFHD
ncbi:MAG: hypothetical protein ABSF57_06940 [Acidobacteriaceae bacterium]